MIIVKKHHQAGYTLIELLLYMAILGSLLTGISMYFVSSTTARVKNQTIAEVDRQGALVMDTILQTIRNADSVTSPTVGNTASSLTLAVPTSSLSPTIFSLDGSGGGTSTVVMGYDQDGGLDSEFNGNVMNATKFVASVSGTVTTLYSRIGAAAGSGNNKGQMAIYSGTSNPSALLGRSTTVLMNGNTWNAFTIPEVSVTSGETYWLVYNTSFVSLNQNNLRYHSGAVNQSMSTGQTYNSWPESWLGANITAEYSMYAEIVTSGGSGAMRVKEGAAANISLTNDKVELSNLTFKNLSRTGTPGVVQVSFTIYRKNPNNRNEYDYQKTFTGTAALRP